MFPSNSSSRAWSLLCLSIGVLSCVCMLFTSNYLALSPVLASSSASFTPTTFRFPVFCACSAAAFARLVCCLLAVLPDYGRRACIFAVNRARRAEAANDLPAELRRNMHHSAAPACTAVVALDLPSADNCWLFTAGRIESALLVRCAANALGVGGCGGTRLA